MAKRKRIESELQQECVRWFRFAYARLKLLLFAIPNGGARSKVEAGIMKGEGVLAGVSDLFLSVAMHGYHGFYIEMKTPGESQKPEQIEFQKAVVAAGYKYIVCHNVDLFMNEINAYLKP